MTVRVPSDFAVRVDSDQGIGDFTAKGLKRRGRYYVNGAYAKGSPRMNIKINQGVGDVTIE